MRKLEPRGTFRRGKERACLQTSTSGHSLGLGSQNYKRKIWIASIKNLGGETAREVFLVFHYSLKTNRRHVGIARFEVIRQVTLGRTLHTQAAAHEAADGGRFEFANPFRQALPVRPPVFVIASVESFRLNRSSYCTRTRM